MKPKIKSFKTPLLFLLFLSSTFLFQNTNLQPVSAVVFTSDKMSSGGSSYSLYLDILTTSWTRGTLVYFDVGLTVNSFGSGVFDFHAIELWMKFDNGSGYEVIDSSVGGSINTEGESFEDSWYLTPSLFIADNFTLYIGSKFLEDTGTSDPYTDDGWTSMANITVSNPPPPSVSHPDDITFNEGDIGQKISWTATHESPDYYEVYQDGKLAEIGVWGSASTTSHSISHLLIGDYEFTIYFYDDYDQSNNDTVLVHVRDLAAPAISSPADLTIEESATGQYIEWTVSDLHPESYELTIDGVIIDSGSWEVYTSLRFSLDALALGTYTYCLNLTDESSNSVIDCVEVEVVETVKSGNASIIIYILSIITLISTSSLLKRKFK